MPKVKRKFSKVYSFGLVTGLFFILVGRTVHLPDITDRNEAKQLGQAFTWSDFFPQFFSSTFGKWQSELLRLVWQVARLAIFYFWGSSSRGKATTG